MIIQADELYNDVVVIPNHEIRQTLAPEYRIACNPLTVDLENVYSAETPRDNLEIFLQVLKNYFVPEIKSLMKNKKNSAAVALLLVVVRESFEQIYDYRSEKAFAEFEKEVNDRHLLDEIQKIKGRINCHRREITRQRYHENGTCPAQKIMANEFTKNQRSQITGWKESCQMKSPPPRRVAIKA